MRRTVKWTSIAVFCLIISAMMLLLCSQSSPLYPINTWVDANCLLTVGRVMRSGGVVYRDIYEQKGPTLYLLHAIAAGISDTSFLGVYVLEAISFAAALFAACRLMMRRVECRAALSLCALIGAFVLTGTSFAQGDSAEEFCLPLLMGALVLSFDAYGRGKPMQKRKLFVCGLLAGLVATIKFTILGLFVGLCVAEGVLSLREGGVRRALRSAGAFLAGMALPILAWCTYFDAHGALSDFLTAYVYNNVFLYTGEARAATDVLRDIWHAVRGNALWVTMAAAGMFAFLLDRREHLALRFGVLSMALCAFACVFLLGRSWPYSPLVLCVFAFACAPSLARLKPRVSGRGDALLALCCALALCVFGTPNAHLRGEKRENLAQTRLARFVHEGATLLQYSHLDDGLYLASGRLPHLRYFARMNVPLAEMDAEMDRYVGEALPDYVLCSWEPLPQRFDRYQLIATDVGYDDDGRLNKLLYLYRRK